MIADGELVLGSQTMALNPKILATPFQVETNWHVLTGAVCCGKTTLIDLLADQGFRTLPETSRQYIEAEVAKGRTLDEIFGSQADERAITALQIRAEHAVHPSDLVFFDRALPDFLWFWRLLGMDPNELLPECLHHRYASVFLLDQLPLRLDGARIEDDAYADRFDAALVHDYGALGYGIERVPVLPPQERVAFVLEKLSQQGLI